MRVVHIDKFYPPTGGVGSYVAALGRLQREHGWEVLGWGCAADPRDDMPPRRDFAASRSGVDWLRMVHSPAAAGALRRWLDVHPVDLAHLHNLYHHLTPSILGVLAARGIPMVMTVHDYRFACPTKHFLGPDGLCTRCRGGRFHHAARCCGLGGAALAAESYIQHAGRRWFGPVGRFLCPSAFLREVLLELGLSPAGATVCPNPVDPPPMPPDVKPRDDEVLFMGRLSAEKGPELMIELAARLPRARVTLAGDGPEAGRLAAMVRRRGLGNVSLLGRLDRRDLGERLAAAAVVVLPSRAMENSPGAMLEAMACGRCVVAPDHPPLREWVEDGRTGRTFATGDAADLARVVGEILADRHGREAMAGAGRALVRRRHSDAAVWRCVTRAYEEARERCGSR